MKGCDLWKDQNGGFRLEGNQLWVPSSCTGSQMWASRELNAPGGDNRNA